MTEAAEHEEALIIAFFIPTKHTRYLEMIATPKKREKFLRELSHFKSLDSRHRYSLPKGIHSAEQIAGLLFQKGAPPTCWVTSEDDHMDGKQMLLPEALREIVGRQIGTFLSCIAGKLAYFEDEDDRWVLERHSS